MNVLLIGAAGLVSSHLRRAFSRERVSATFHRTPAPDARRLDLTDFATARALVAELRPDVILLAGAEAHVDRCEREPAATRLVNVEATRVLADAARATGSLLVVFSSEYVFDGTAGPYAEDDAAQPLGARRSRSRTSRGVGAHLVCRTSGVFGWEPLGKNFVCQLVRRLRAGETFDVPDDQVLTPTYAPELARAVAELVRRGARGAFHVAGPRGMVRAEFARLVASVFRLPLELVRPRATALLGTVAPRPGPRSGLSDEKLRRTLGRGLMDLAESLADMRTTEGRAGAL